MRATPSSRHCVIAMAAVLALGASVESIHARTLLKNICRVKGQEENVLRGLGLVVGLNGTGDSGDYLPTMRSLARSMELMGNPVGNGAARDGGALKELKDTKNVALVIVEATVPATGARRGDKLNCQVSAISAKSLAGGRLIFASLQGPNLKDQQVYALASGPVHLDDEKIATVGKIHDGCRVEEDFYNVFEKDGMITLVLDKSHADFAVAADVALQINDLFSATHSQASYPASPLAKAIDPLNIVVRIPSQERADPVQFVAEVLSLPIYEPRVAARVTINERAGSIVISGDVEIGAVIVTHKNVVIEAGGNQSANDFVAIDSRSPDSPKLAALVNVLDALQVSAQDKIEIIKGIDRNGKLHGKLIIE